MSNYPFKDMGMKKAELGNSTFVQKKPARIGSKKSPAQISVQTEARKAELMLIFQESAWNAEIIVDPDKAENILDLEFLQNKKSSTTVEKKPNRNEPCSCGSGKKYKKCCQT